MSDIPLDAKVIFHQACSFDYAVGLLITEMENKVRQPSSTPSMVTSLLVPIVVNSAFTVELFFKCLIASDTPTFHFSSHDLSLLFQRINADDKRKIKEAYTKNSNSYLSSVAQWPDSLAALKTLIKNEDHRFDTVLEESAKDFEKWRYLYENDSPQIKSLISCVRSPAQKTILNRKPEWQTIVDSFDHATT